MKHNNDFMIGLWIYFINYELDFCSIELCILKRKIKKIKKRKKSNVVWTFIWSFPSNEYRLNFELFAVWKGLLCHFWSMKMFSRYMFLVLPKFFKANEKQSMCISKFYFTLEKCCRWIQLNKEKSQVSMKYISISTPIDCR